MGDGSKRVEIKNRPLISAYQIGGSLSSDAPTYVVRQADSELQAAISDGEFCYVFNARQMGKSSLRVRTKHQLQEMGYRCASIDLSRLGSENLTPMQWYKGIMLELWRAFNLIGTVNLIAWFQTHAEMPPTQQLSLFVEEILLAQIPSKLVILIDEIDSILSLNFSMDDFFVWIRSCYNQRAENPDYHRLTFALFGVATPSDLIQDRQRTPFNIGRAIELQGFKLHETNPLMQGLAEVVDHPEAVLKEILHWTGGQPLLTQKLCQIVLEKCQNEQKDLDVSKPVSAGAMKAPFLHRMVTEALSHHSNIAVQIGTLVQTHVIDDWETQDYPEHLRTILYRILKQGQRLPRLLDHYRELLETGSLKADCSPEQGELLLSGLAVKQAGHLRIRNPIYQAVFNLEWVYQIQTKHPFSTSCDYQKQTLVHPEFSCSRPNLSECADLQTVSLQGIDKPVPQALQSGAKTIKATTVSICIAFINHLEQMNQTEIEAVTQAIMQRSPEAASIMNRILTQELSHSDPIVVE